MPVAGKHRARRLAELVLGRAPARIESTETRTTSVFSRSPFAVAWLVVAWRSHGRTAARLRVGDRRIRGGRRHGARAGGCRARFRSSAARSGRRLGSSGSSPPPSESLRAGSPVVMAALVPLAALGLQAAVRIGRAKRGRASPPSALVAAAMLPLVRSSSRFTHASPSSAPNVPPEYEAARALHAEGIVAEYPLVQDVDRLFWQRDARTPSSERRRARNAAHDAGASMLVDPGARTAEALAFLGVTAIVRIPTHSTSPTTCRCPDASLGARVRARRARRRTDRPCGASLRRRPCARHAPRRFRGPTCVDGGGIGYPLVSPSGVGIMEFIARAPSVARLSFRRQRLRPARSAHYESRTRRQSDRSTLDGPTQITVRRRDSPRSFLPRRQDRSRRDVGGGRNRAVGATRATSGRRIRSSGRRRSPRIPGCERAARRVT